MAALEIARSWGPPLGGALLGLAGKAALDAWPRGARPSRRHLSTAVGALFVAGAVALEATRSIPTIPPLPGHDRLDVALSLLGVALWATLWLAAFAFGTVLMRYVLGPEERALPPFVSRGAAKLASAALFVLALAGVVRAATRPSLDAHFAGLTARAERVAFGDMGDPAACRPHSEPPAAPEVRAPLGDVDLVRTCGSSPTCTLSLVGRDRPSMDAYGAHLSISWCASYAVTRLAPDLVVVEESAREFYSRTVVTTQETLLRRERLWRRGTVGDFARIRGRAAPPGLWVGASLLAALAVGGCWLHRRAALRSLRSLDDARPGTLGEDGWVSFADGPARRLAAGDALRAGPVVVLSRSAQGEAYRDLQTLAPAHVLPGTIEAQRDAARDAVVRHEAWALSIAALGAAPLVAAAVAGLVF